MLFLIKWYHLKWVSLPLSHCSVKITTEENHLVILFSWLKCLYSFILYSVKFHLNERLRVSFLTQLIMCPHIPITVRAQLHWIQQQHVSIDPDIRRKPKVCMQPPEIKRVFHSQSSLGEKDTHHPLSNQLLHIGASSWCEGSSSTASESLRPGYFRLFFCFCFGNKTLSPHGKLSFRVLYPFVLFLKFQLSPYLTKILFSWWVQVASVNLLAK